MQGGRQGRLKRDCWEDKAELSAGAMHFRFCTQQLKRLRRPGCSCASTSMLQAEGSCLCKGGAGPARACLVGGEGRAQRGAGGAGHGRPLQRLRTGAGVRTHQLAGGNMLAFETQSLALPSWNGMATCGRPTPPRISSVCIGPFEAEKRSSVGLGPNCGVASIVTADLQACRKGRSSDVEHSLLAGSSPVSYISRHAGVPARGGPGGGGGRASAGRAA